LHGRRTAKQLIFVSDRNGHTDIFKQALDKETPETLVSGGEDKVAGAG